MLAKQKLVRRQLFPEKLWELVNEPCSGIQWSPDGKRIEVERSQLEKFTGTKFRSHNFDSFIRQLHFYGFRKTGNSYHHDKFQRGQPEALLSMKRKYSHLPLTPITKHSTHSSQPTSESPATQHLRLAQHQHSFPEQEQQHQDQLLDPKELQVSSQEQIDNEQLQILPAIQQHERPIIPEHNVQSCTKNITLYTLIPASQKDRDQQVISCNQINDGVSFFATYRDNVSKTNTNNYNSIRITMPDIMSDTADKNSWPQTLVLESYSNGNQDIISAYFVYRAAGSH